MDMTMRVTSGATPFPVTLAVARRRTVPRTTVPRDLIERSIA